MKAALSVSQGGFLIPLALVLLVGISFLAIAVNRLSGQTGSNVVVGGLSVQALYAAESGAQFGMNQLFFNASSRTQTDGNCTALSGSSLNFNAVGLTACSATVLCSQTTDASNTVSYYTVNSVAVCGAAQLLGEREVEISAFMQ